MRSSSLLALGFALAFAVTLNLAWYHSIPTIWALSMAAFSLAGFLVAVAVHALRNTLRPAAAS